MKKPVITVWLQEEIHSNMHILHVEGKKGKVLMDMIYISDKQYYMLIKVLTLVAHDQVITRCVRLLNLNSSCRSKYEVAYLSIKVG